MAKGGGEPIPLYLTFFCPDVIVKAHVEPGSHTMIVVDKSYLGPFPAGQSLSVAEPKPADSLTTPIVNQPAFAKTILYLFLKHTPKTAHSDYPNVVGWDWTIDWGLSKRLSDPATPLTKKLSFQSPPPTPEAVEKDIAQGLARRDQWQAALAESDPAKKVVLLRPFLITGADGIPTPYELWWSGPLVLDEVAKTGQAGVDLLQSLLKEPCYQTDFDPQWLGFGGQERAILVKSLALQEFHVALTPDEKLAKLRPLFDLPSYEFRAGTYPEGLLNQYLDRGLAAVVETGSAHAKPFLHDLQKLPYFQENYSSPMEQNAGRDRHAKIEAALAQLK
jgi:hypothetical protein